MGFKRTAEGRVFFKGADNDVGSGGEDLIAAADSIVKGDQTQMQILLLLKSLNTKLQNSREEQKDLKNQLTQYKDALHELETRAGRHEENYLDLEQKVARKQTETSKKASRVETAIRETVKDFKAAQKLMKELEGKTAESNKAMETLEAETKKRQALESELRKSAKAIEEMKAELSARKKLDAERKKQQEDLEKRQKTIEDRQKEQGDKIADSMETHVALTKRVSETETRQEALDNKIEDTASEYIKLDRKIDKIMDDRMRVMRKIERVEDAVMQTRDALNAKAMVLLTNQGIAGVDVPQIPGRVMDMDPVALQRRMQEEAMMPWWKRPLRIHSAAMLALILIGALAGWYLGERGRSAANDAVSESPRVALRVAPPERMESEQAASDSFRPSADQEGYAPKSDYMSPVAAPVAPESVSGPDSVPDPVSPPDERASAEVTGTVPASYDEALPVRRVSDDIGTLDISDEESILAALEKDPDAVAARMNAIEPSSLTSGDHAGPESDIPAEPDVPVSEPVSADRSADSPALPPKAVNDIRKRITPDPDLPDIARKIESQAFAGVPEAQHDMGAIYVAGHGQVRQNLGRAIAWFEEAAANGVANAKYNLGVMYHQGMGVPQSLEKALELYDEAAALGHPEAQYNLGIANIEGIGVDYDPHKAAQYFENAARNGVVEAAYNLGLIYENGLLGKPRPDEALMWYKTAADKGSPEAKAALEQLASSIGVSLADVNRIVESVKDAKGYDAEPEQAGISQQSLVSQIQSELMRLGLYPGPVDGQIGPLTSDAIRSFQAQVHIPDDGKPSAGLLSALRSQGPVMASGTP